MYDELIRQMMACCKGVPCEDANCGFNPKSDLDCIEQLLTRAADAIEELQKDLEWSKDFEAFWQHAAEEALKKFQVAISNKPRWIPVTERLPELKERVLVVDRFHIIGVASLEPLWDSKVFLGDDCSLLDSASGMVTHWMPLPQPPESEGKT